MKLINPLLLCLLITMFGATEPISAQVNSSDSINLRADAVKIFIDCERCDMDYIRREIPYVNYVRDVKEAEVYILEIGERNGSGGTKYTYTFEGQMEYEGMNDIHEYSTGPDDTDEIRREGRTQVLRLGLMRYVVKTSLQNSVAILPTRDFEQEEEEVVDKWNNWVFRISTRPEFEAQDAKKEFDFRNSFSAAKITEEWKIESEFEHEYRSTRYIFEDTLYNRYRSGQSFDNLIVKSLGEHWSVGGRIELESSTYRNTHFGFDVLPAIEYNIFPYSQSSHHQLRTQYSVGYSYRSYNDSTIYGKLEENLYKQQFQVAFMVVDKWGDVNISLSASNFLHDFSKNRIELQGGLEIRIFKGLSLRLSGGVARIRDQLSLPKGELSEADILLSLQELETGFELNGGLSLSYTFGSIYNNVVNPRFGNRRRGGGR